MSESFLPPHGGFRNLKSFQIGQKVYGGTVLFCDRFIEKRSRTHNQMVQAARSGVQNIAEGSLASAASKETELKLTNVARARLDARDKQKTAQEPQAPACGKLMRKRTAKTGPKTGRPFWGCSGHPECRGTRSVEQ